MHITKSSKGKRTDDIRSHGDEPSGKKARTREPRKELSAPGSSELMKKSKSNGTIRTHILKDYFKYQPLNSRRNEIRLLWILPIRTFDGIDCGIECNISCVSLDDLPDYDALSYAWGDTINLRIISLGGRSVKVTSNLYGFLSHFQISCTKKPIWVDALCINQDDLQERGDQVEKMGDIFKQAGRVITWLGPADNGSRLAFSLLGSLRDALHDSERCRVLLKDKKNIENLYGLYSLFYRHYWWRVWVIQEVTLAKTIQILCGGDAILWSDLVEIQETLIKHHLRDIDFVAHEVSKLSFLRESIESRGPRAMLLSPLREPSDLTQILLQHRFKESSDPKDMIYSLVGLSAAHRDPRFNVDYSKSVCQVYTELVEYVLATTRKLDIICAIPRGSNPYKLPSWVPDWSFHGPGSSFLEHSSKHQFSAAGTSEAQAKVSRNKARLHAKGVCIGIISSTGATSRMEDLEDEIHAVLAFYEWQTLIVEETGEHVVLGTCLCKKILQEKYKSDEFEDWTAKSDFIPWILGTFVRAMVAVSPDIELDTCFTYFKNYRSRWRSSEEDQVLGKILLKGAAEMMFGRRILISDSKFLGLGPESIAKGDIIVVLLGCQLPIVLRRDNQYAYLGEAFVDGYMYGHAMTELENGSHQLVDFDIR